MKLDLVKHFRTILVSFFKAERSYRYEECCKVAPLGQDLFEKVYFAQLETVLAVLGSLDVAGISKSLGWASPPPELCDEDSQEGYFNFFVTLQNSQARGDFQLKPDDPQDAPLINPNYLGYEYDVVVIIKALRQAMKYMDTPTL